MDAAELDLRARRLGRLRSSIGGSTGGGVGDGAPLATTSSRLAVGQLPGAAIDRRRRRADGLAAAVGGRVIHGDAGTIVEIERSGPLPVRRDALARLPDRLPEGPPVVCLDTETTGLGTAAGTLAFLCGLGVWHGDRFTVRQLLLPDHADEPALLDRLASVLSPTAWLVTYNGRSFDWPLLVARFRLHGHRPPVHAGHLDLLPLARQVWRHRLADARLATVERGVAGIHRIDDLPGAAIPERYFRFLRTGQGGLLADVVRHNRQDVASLARLLATLADGLGRGRLADLHAGDLWGLARAYSRRRRLLEALECLDAAGRTAPALLPEDPWVTPMADRVTMDRARVLARMGRAADAFEAWLTLAQGGGRLSGLAWIQVAKHHEHRRHDPLAALTAAMGAERAASAAAAAGMPLPWVERDMRRRLPRLRRLALTISARPMT